MSLAHALHLLPLGFLCVSLPGQDPKPKPIEKPEPAVQITNSRVLAPAQTASSRVDAPCESHHCDFRHRRLNCRHSGHHSTFGIFGQGVMPLRTLKEDLDQRTGYGLGLQWTHDHGDRHASRTRIEWNTFPEGGAVAGTRTYAKNILLSWDHLFNLNKQNKGESHVYLVSGIGGSKWYLEHSTDVLRDARWTTKLAITGGIGIQIADRMNLEARYVVSSINQTFDANTMQMSLGWQF